MAIAERLTDIPTLRALERAGGLLTTQDLRRALESQFGDSLGQWNIISNMDSTTSLFSRDLATRQVKRDGIWVTFNRHLTKEEARIPQRIVLTERGRVLLASISTAQDTIPSDFEKIISERVAIVQEQAESVNELITERDEADTDTPPAEAGIPKDAPQAPKPGDHVYDPEARRQANARRVARHHALVVAVAEKATSAGLVPTQSRYADVLVRTDTFGAILEVKTVNHSGQSGSQSDLIAQLRAAIAQLYHYRFIHRISPGFEHDVKLFAVFDAVLPPDLTAFLREIGIGTIWFTDGRFQGEAEALEQLPWLSA